MLYGGLFSASSVSEASDAGEQTRPTVCNGNAMIYFVSVSVPVHIEDCNV